MFSSIAEKITRNLCEKQIIPESDMELYEYGFNNGLTIILNLLSTLLVGFLFSMVFESAAFMAFYIPLRSRAGGYHARTPLRCYFLSLVIIALVLSFMKYAPVSFILYGAVLVFGTAVCFALSPVEDENKPLDETECIVYRRRSLIILSAQIGIWLLYVVIFRKYGRVIPTVVFTESAMLIFGKIKNLRRACEK